MVSGPFYFAEIKNKFAKVALSLYLRFMKKGKASDTGTLRVNKELIRRLKAYLAPVGGKMNVFVENVLEEAMRKNRR